MEYREIFSSVFKKSNILFNEPMSNLTSFRIGGPADVIFYPENKFEILYCIDLCKEKGIKYTSIGNGSNLLVNNNGIRGVVICISKSMSGLESKCGGCVCAAPGITLAGLAAFAADKGLSGLEFASGIPGTLGGAVTMNAGAYGGEMKDVVTEVEVLDKNGKFIKLKNGQMNFSYRASIIQKEEYIVTSVTVKLTPCEKQSILEKMTYLNTRRRESQPLELPSAGSTFKRPDGYYAAKLIDDSGLRGCSIGGACVSEKHCGFIVNKGGASFDDVLRLIEHVRTTVWNKFGVMLELEVKIIGD